MKKILLLIVPFLVLCSCEIHHKHIHIPGCYPGRIVEKRANEGYRCWIPPFYIVTRDKTGSLHYNKVTEYEWEDVSLGDTLI